MSSYRKFSILRSKFTSSLTKQLLSLLSQVNWNIPISQTCQQLSQLSQECHAGKFVWLIGTNPSYFIQYQIDSYAIFKNLQNQKIVIVWKPKYLEYPAIHKIIEFGPNAKIIKSLSVKTEQKQQISPALQETLSTFIKNYYSANFFTTQQSQFQKQLLTQLKHLTSRSSSLNYWHCCMDNHNQISLSICSSSPSPSSTSSSHNPLIKFHISGLKQKYQKDIIIFSKQGVREWILKGKSMQIISFFAMLIIFIAIIGCSGENDQSGLGGYCSYRDQMILGSAAIMMGLMGMRVASRNRYKKKLDMKIKQLEKQQ